VKCGSLIPLLAVASLALPSRGRCQQIRYSIPLGDNIRSTDFDIVGRCGGQLLIYKSSFGNHIMGLYDDDMKIQDQVPLKFLPHDVLQEDFVNLGHRVIMIYQYRRRRDLYCKAVSLDAGARTLSRPRLLARTGHADQAEASYAVVHSEDKSRIMVLEVLRNEDSMLYRIRTLLVDTNLHVLSHGNVQFPFTGAASKPGDFRLEGDGSLYFVMGGRRYATDNYYQTLTLYCKAPFASTLHSDSIPLDGHLPDTSLLVKIDNQHRNIWVAALQYGRRQKDIDRLVVSRFSCGTLSLQHSATVPLTDSLQKIMQGDNEGPNGTFDDYVLSRMVIDRQQNALVIAEEKFTDLQNVDHYDNVGLFELDREGKLLKLTKIKKDQGGDLASTFASFLLVNSGGELHLLMNKPHRIFRFLNNYVYLLTDYRYGPDHTLTQMPVMRGLDNKRRWAPRFGSQISRDEVVIPCVSGSSLLFGKITYPAVK
jgi:hypothetical protein